jgi:hypothetical protein
LFAVQDVFVLPINREIIGKTIENVVKKFSFTRLNSIKRRTAPELLDNLIQGDLAKNSMLWYLRRQKLCLLDYDEIRTDDFKEPDPDWDMCTPDEKTFIEVKSSLPPDYLKKGKEKFSNRIVDELDIKITAGSNRKAGGSNPKNLIPPNQLKADIHIQVYYNADRLHSKNSANNFEKIKKLIETNSEAILEITRFRERLNKPYFFGYCTRNEIEEYLEYLEKKGQPQTWEYEDCIYWRYPIHFARNMSRLVELLQ